jgi:hypothetical protein
LDVALLQENLLKIELLSVQRSTPLKPEEAHFLDWDNFMDKKSPYPDERISTAVLR